MYATIDPRILGLFRIYFGGLLLYDLLRRVPYAGLLYSNDGVLPNHFTLYSPQATPQFSLLFPFSTTGEVRVAFALIGLVYALYTVGLFTRVVQVLALLGAMSLNGRNLFLEDGGVVSTLLLAVFTLFLPVGACYSLDAIRARWRACPDPAVDAARRPEPPAEIWSVWVLLITFQLAAIYFFNTVHKTGSTWKTGEAVHWVLWQNRVVTWFAAWFRQHEPSWFSPLMTWGTLVVEGSLPVLLLLPIHQKRARLAALILGAGLHLGIAAMMELGPFSYAMIGFWILVQKGELLDDLRERWGDRFTWNIRYDRRHPGARLLARCLLALDGRQLLEWGAAPAGTTWETRGEDGKAKKGLEGVALACSAIPVIGGVVRGWVRRGWLRSPVRRQLALPAGNERSPLPPPPVEPERSWRWVVREGAAVFVFIAIVLQISVDNSSVPRWLRRAPMGPFATVIVYPRLLQGWKMFAPDAPREDGIIVVDATTVGGRHIDPFTGLPPNFAGASKGPVVQGVPVCDYLFELHLDRGTRYRPELRRYLDQWHTLPGHTPQDRLVDYEVWWLENQTPPPGSKQPSEPTRTLVLKK